MSTFKGRISSVSPIQSGTSKSGKAWRRVDVCLVYDESKPDFVKSILFSVMNDNIEKFGFVPKSIFEVEVDFSVREYNSKHYMSASCWKATRLDAQQQTQPSNNPYAATMPPKQQVQQAQQQEDSELPF